MSVPNNAKEQGLAEIKSDIYQYQSVNLKRQGFTASTVCGLFLERCKKTPNQVALRYKEGGIWKGVTWEEYYQHAEAFGLGLLELGIERGERVAMMSPPRPEWFYLDMAVQGVGGISYGIYLTSSVPQMEYIMGKGEAKFFVAYNQEILGKILQVADRLPNLRKIIVMNPRDKSGQTDSRLMSFEEVEEIGRKRREREPELFQKMVSRVKPDDIAAIMWTTGTTGPPKGSMDGQMTAVSAMFWGDIFPEHVGSNERSVSYLPLEHGYARAYDVWAPIAIGSVVYITESRDKLEEVFREVQPTHFISIPRTLEKWATQALEDIEQSIWVKRWAYRVGVWIGRRVLPRKWEGKTLGLNWRFLDFLAKQLAFNSILKKFGVSKVKFCLTGGTMVPTRVVSLWHMWGLEMREGYAGAEMSMISIQMGRWPKPGNAGKILPWVETRLSSEGELLTRGPGEFVGYWGDEEATKKAKGDGWIHTGDIVEILEDKSIKIVDRIKEIIITSGGENLSPSVIEDALKTSPYIKEAAVFGDAHKYPVALVEMNFEKIAEWAREHGISDTSPAALMRDGEVKKLMEEEVKKGNAQLARVQQVKQFRIAPQELNPGVAGSWVKLQRKRLYQQYHDLIESMYVDEKARIGAELGDVAKEVRELKERA